MIRRSVIAAFGSTPVISPWTQRANDDFTGTNGTNLTATGNWSAQSGRIDNRNAGGETVAINNSASTLNLYAYTGVSFLTNQYAQCTLFKRDASTFNCGIAVRVQAATASGYALAYDTSLRIYRYDSGGFNNLVGVARTYTGGERIRLEAVGAGSATRLTAYEDTGSGFTAIGTMTNFDPSTYYDNGSPGLYGFSAFFGFEVDTWSGGDEP